jgi:hypothetical protein
MSMSDIQTILRARPQGPGEPYSEEFVNAAGVWLAGLEEFHSALGARDAAPRPLEA